MKYSLNSVVNVTASSFRVLTLADFLRDACDVCPRKVSDGFPCTSRFVRFDGRWIFSLRDEKDPDVHVANLA